MRRLAVIGVVIGLLAGAVFAYAAHDAQSGHNAPAPKQHFQVRAHVRGLYPGASKNLKVRIKNHTGRRVRVTKLRVLVRRASNGCRRSSLHAHRPRREFRLQPHSGRTMKVGVAMRRSAPNACQGRKFRLRINARIKHRT